MARPPSRPDPTERTDPSPYALLRRHEQGPDDPIDWLLWSERISDQEAEALRAYQFRYVVLSALNHKRRGFILDYVDCAGVENMPERLTEDEIARLKAERAEMERQMGRPFSATRKAILSIMPPTIRKPDAPETIANLRRCAHAIHLVLKYGIDGGIKPR